MKASPKRPKGEKTRRQQEAALLEAMQAAPTPPCAECNLTARCATGMACQAFKTYVEKGKYFRNGVRVPSRRIFRKCYPAEDRD